MVDRGPDDRLPAPDPTRDRATTDGPPLAQDELVAPSVRAGGRVARRWLRAVPAWALGVGLVTVATAWPWLALMAWVQRGGPYFWWFALGCLLVTALAYLRFLDERVLRCVARLRGPSVAREEHLLAALAAAGAPAATVWLGDVAPDRAVCLATPTRWHVVVAQDPAVDDATLAADAARQLGTVRPWLRPLTVVAGGAWLGPFTLAAQLLLRRLGIGNGGGRRSDGPDDDGLDPTGAVDPVTAAVAFLGSGLTGFATAGAAAALFDEPGRLNLSAGRPWVTVASVAFFAALTWMILLVWPKNWGVVPVEGSTFSASAPMWRGTDDRRAAGRNRAVLAARRSFVQVFGTFGSFVVAMLWSGWVPLALLERFGWIQEATTSYQLTAAVLILPATALGVYAFRSAWGLQEGSPLLVLGASAVYLVTTGLTPLLVWCLAATHVVDVASDAALVVAHALVAAVLAVGSTLLARALLLRHRKPAARRPGRFGA